MEDLRHLDVESAEYRECVNLRDDLARARMNARERMSKLNVDIVMEEAARKGRDKIDRIRMDRVSIGGSPNRQTQQQRQRGASPASPASLQRQKRIAPTPPRTASAPRNPHSNSNTNTKVKQYEGSNCGGSDQFEDQARSMRLTLARSAKGSTSLDKVVGHAKAKDAIRESVILPSLRLKCF